MFTLWVRQENPFSRSMRARKALTVQVFFAEQAHETGLNMWNSAILAYRRAADRRWECA